MYMNINNIKYVIVATNLAASRPSTSYLASAVQILRQHINMYVLHNNNVLNL